MIHAISFRTGRNTALFRSAQYRTLRTNLKVCRFHASVCCAKQIQKNSILTSPSSSSSFASKRAFSSSSLLSSSSLPRKSKTTSKRDSKMAIDTPRFLVSLDPEHPHAKAPTRGSALAAGYDLYASQETVIPKNGRKIVQTGIRVAVPQGCYGRVAPRSGLASKHGIDTGAGVIDADYRGLLGVLLFNFSDADFTINVGDRIAQLVLERIVTPEVEAVESLDETVRGAGGFGSTGGFGVPVKS